jgi:hypothetical protein
MKVCNYQDHVHMTQLVSLMTCNVARRFITVFLSGMQRPALHQSGYPGIPKTVEKTNQSAEQSAHKGMPPTAVAVSVNQHKLQVDFPVFMGLHSSQVLPNIKAYAYVIHGDR